MSEQAYNQLLTENHELKRTIRNLNEELAQLRAERDIARAKIYSLLPKATPEQEAELQRHLSEPQYTSEEVMAEVYRIVGGSQCP